MPSVAMGGPGPGLGGHNCFGPPFLFVKGLFSTGPTPSSFYLWVDMGLPIQYLKDLVLHKLCSQGCSTNSFVIN